MLASLRRYGQDAQYDKSQLWHCRSEFSKILGCRDGSFGSHEFQCGACGHRRVVYAACNNRHCPSCSWLKRKVWLENVVSWRLPCEYYHTVFTVPHRLNRLLMANQRECYRLFFHTAQDTLLHMAKKQFGCQPGMILTLHTWGQRMLTHIHIHVIMTAGGMSIPAKPQLTADGTLEEPSPMRWIPIPPDAPGMENDALALEFRKRFVRGLKLLYKKGLLEMPFVRPGANEITTQAEFNKRLDQIALRPWVADAKRTPKHLRTEISLLKYGSKYVFGIAISDYRILIDEDGNVTIKYKCYTRKIRTTETMTGEEFVRRFMLHIVPKSIHRVRYGGIFHGKWREPRLNQCRELLIEYNEKNDIHYYSSAASSTPASSPPTTEPTQDERKQVEPKETEPKQVEKNLPKCARCKTPAMQSLGFQDKTTTRAIIAISQRVIALYAVSWTTLEDWSLYVLKNVRIKKEIRGIAQTWIEFDKHLQQQVLYSLPDCLTRVVIDSHCESLTNHDLPIPDW